MSANLASGWWSGSAAAAVLLLWEVGARAIGSDADFPALSAVVTAIWRDRALIFHNLLPTTAAALIGLTIALFVAFCVATLSALSARGHRALTPLVFAQQTIPLLAIAPLVAPLIGHGLLSVALIAAWLCWFPAAAAFTIGFLQVDPERLAVFRVAGATRWQIHRRLRIPGAASMIVAGVRGSAGFALIGAIVAEYGGIQRGLGALVIRHVTGAKPLPADTLFGVVLTCAALGAALTFGAQALARSLLGNWLRPGGTSVLGS